MSDWCSFLRVPVVGRAAPDDDPVVISGHLGRQRPEASVLTDDAVLAILEPSRPRVLHGLNPAR